MPYGCCTEGYNIIDYSEVGNGPKDPVMIIICDLCQMVAAAVVDT